VKHSIRKAVAHLILGLTAGACVSCGGGGGGGGGGPTSNNPPGDFSVLVGTDEFFGTVTSSSRTVTRLTGESLFGHLEASGLAYDTDNSVAYAYFGRNGELATLDLASGKVHILGPVAGTTPLHSLAYDTDNHTLYGINSDAELVSVDPGGPSATTVGAVGFANTTDLSFDATTHKFYSIDRSGPTKLLSIAPASGAGAAVGASLPDFVERLAVRAGALYGLNRDTNQLYTINKTTAATASVGPTGFTIPGALEYGPGDRFYTVGRNPDQDGNVLISIDPASGAGRFEAALGFNAIGGMAYDPAANPVLYATETSGDNLIRIDTATAQPTLIGPLGYDDVEGLTWDANHGILYGMDTPSQQLITVDTGTGAGTAVGNTGVVGMKSLAYDPNHDALYAVSTTTDRLYAIDAGSGSASPIGSGLGQAGVEALAYDAANDSLYGVNSDGNGNGQLLKIDVATGAATLVSPTGSDQATTLTFDPDTGQLLGNTPSADALVRIDPATGKATGINHTGYFSLDGLAYDEANHRYFSAASRKLVSLNADTGEGTGIGPMGVDSVVHLAYDPNTGALFGYDVNPRQLVKINATTGAATVLGSTAPDVVSALAFDSRRGRLYGFINNQLCTLDTGTGHATPIGAANVVNVSGMTYDPGDDTLYALGSAGSGPGLYVADRGTGALTLKQGYDYQIRAIAYK